MDCQVTILNAPEEFAMQLGRGLTIGGVSSFGSGKIAEMNFLIVEADLRRIASGSFMKASALQARFSIHSSYVSTVLGMGSLTQIAVPIIPCYLVDMVNFVDRPASRHIKDGQPRSFVLFIINSNTDPPLILAAC